MYIKKLTLTQFRNIEGTLEIQFLETQVVVLGANGAGKSNIPLAVGFVLNCDGKFLNIKNDVDLINQAHQRENEMASCSVELLLEDETSDNKGNPMTVKTILKRTLDVQSRSVYMIDGIINTKEQYDATVRAINLRPRAVLIPQRALTDFESSSNYGYGKCIESLFRDLADREFSSDDEKQLIKDKADASKLKQRIAVCKNMIDNLRRSQGNNAAPTPDLELEIGKCERLLILAALWRIDTRIQQGKNSLGELRKAVENLESYQVVTEQKIERTQVEMQKVIKELDAYDEAEVGRKDLEEKALSKQNVLQGLEASRSRLQEIINRVQNSTSGSPGSNTEASEELLRQMEELEVSSSLGAFLYDKMEEFNERFEAEHPEDFNAMMTLREADRSQYSHRRDIQNQLRIEGRKRFLAREEKRVTMESIESFDEKIFRMETKISVYRSFMKNNESDMEAIEKLILKKQNRLKHLQRFRCATRREPRHRNEFALRCLIEGAGEYFADEFPARAIYGLLQDLIEPRREIDRISIERALSEYLDSIVVKDRYVQGRMKALMGGDGEYKAPRTKILVLPRAGKSRRGLTRQREGIPLVHTFRVSDLFNGDRITAARILRLFNDLARNILYCQDYSQSLTFIKRCQRLKQEDEAPVEALSADGVMISRSAAMKLFPQFPEMELPFPDDLRSMADIEKEIQGLEAFLRRQPGVGFVLYKSLQFGIELSVRKLERELALIKKQREAAVSKLSSLDPFIQNCDEVYRTVESNLMLLRSGPEAVARRRERLRINTIRMGYMSADADAPRGFSEAEITAALEHDQLENILEQDYILSKLIEASEDGVREQWRSRMDGMLETLGQVRVAEVSREQQTAHKDLESARKSLLERRDFLQATMSDKQTKMEKRERLNAELSKLRCGMRTLIRETERFKIKVQHNILHLKNLRRRRQELLLKRDIMDPDANSNDTYEMELDVNIDEGKLVRAPPAIDYTDIPTSAKESEETINNFIKSTKNTLKALRLEKLDKIVMTRNAAQIDDPDSKKKLEEKTATLKTCEEDLKRLETRIKTFDESKRRYNEILNSYVPRVLQEVPRIYEKLTGLKIKVKTEKSASNGYKDAKISFYGSSEKFQSFDFECITGGEKAILLLSIVLAIQMTEETPFLILDEIDARVNDRSCLNLNRAISRYATSRQVICISHKPEIMRDVNVQLIGMIRCPIKRNVIALSYDPRADYTDNFNEHACKFRGCLTSEEVEFILTENPRSEFP